MILLGATAGGIFGLASFWVRQRRRQIGIRRAIGATRSDILHYFQTENFLIVSGGIALGMVLASAESGADGALRIAATAAVLSADRRTGALGVGQLAVLGPALRAAAVPPVVATRSV